MAGIFLLVFTVWGIFAWKNNVETKRSIISDPNSVNTQTVESPINTKPTSENNVADDSPKSVDFSAESSLKTEPTATPKPFVPQSKTKQNPEVIKQPTPEPTVLPKEKTPIPKSVKNPKPNKNPDCIFNNDCR